MKILKGFTSRKSSFERSIKPRLNELYSQAYRLIGSRDEAEDLVQDFVLRLYKKNVDINDYENPRAWLYKGLYRQFLNHIRSNSRTPFGYIAEAESEAIEENSAHYESPENIAEIHFEINQVDSALHNLKPEHRELIVMHDVEGFTLQELVEIIGVPLGTLKSRIHRARNALKNTLIAEPNADKRCVKD